MWHASSIEKKVYKSSLSTITSEDRYLDYVLIVKGTDNPAKVGLYVDSEAVNEKEFTYSIYNDPECSQYIGRISSICTLSEQTKLENIKIYPNEDKTTFERTIYVRRDLSPYKSSAGEGDQYVYQIIIRIEAGDEGRGKLTYNIYGSEDIRYYSGSEITDYEYLEGGQVIPIRDFR